LIKKQITKLAILVFLLIVVLTNNLQAQEVWSLERCIEHAYKNNLQLKLNDLNIENTKIGEKQAKANRLPSLNVNADYSINFAGAIDPTTYEFRNQQIQNNGFRLTTQVPVYQGGRLNKLIEKSQLDLQKVLVDKEVAKNDISLSIASTYLNVLLAKEQLAITNNQKVLSVEQKNNTQKLIDAGMVPEGDILDLESQIATNELNIITAQNGYDLALLNLKLQLDIDPNIEIELETPPEIEPSSDLIFSYKVNDIYNTALENQPEIKSAGLGNEISMKNLEIAKTGKWPTLSFVGSLATNFSSARQEIDNVTFDGFRRVGFVGLDTANIVNDFMFTPSFKKIKYGTQINDNFLQYVGLNLQIPIFNQFRVKNEIEQAELGIKRAELDKRIVEQNLNRAIRQAYADALAASKNYEATQKSIEVLKTSYEFTEKRFNLGLANSLELRTAQNALALNELQAKSNKYDYLFKLKILDFYLGNPIKF